MKLFDLHADIGYDVMQKKRQGITSDIVTTYHIPSFQKGEIQYLCMASFFSGEEDWSYMQTMITSLIADLKQCDDVDIVLDAATLLEDNGHIKVLLSVEGMCGITKEAREKIRWMWEQGVRVASFCWNEENALATGVRGTSTRGLSEMGKEALDEMIHLHMVVDVSHANEKTFWDIMERDDVDVIATHSNARNLCQHPRNLWDEQILEIQRRHGLIGFNSAPGFIDADTTKQDVHHLVDHVQYMKALCSSIDILALGFDFMDYYDDYEAYCEGLKDSSQAQNMVLALRGKGFDDAEIRQIAHQNALDYFVRVLQKTNNEYDLI